MMKSKILIYIAVFFLLTGCQSGADDTPADRFDTGTIHISADESFKPVIDSQVQVYEGKYPDVNIIVHYKPEAECLRDMAVDSIRLMVVTRKYSKSEEDFMVDSMKTLPSQMVLAYDAIAVIVNHQAKDSLFTMDDIHAILTGKFKKNLIPVFDGLKATSTIRFVVDSVLRGDTLTDKAVAARSSEEVINYISKTPDAIGFIGVSWIGNPEDTLQRSFLTKVKLAQLESTDVPGRFVQPVQANIYTGRYPMIRELVYILKEKHRGLGHAFSNFMSGERGQLVFKRAYLVPGQMRFGIRRASLREESKD